MALVAFAKHLLIEEGFNFMCLAEFSTDRLDKPFGQLRQGSGGTYFISAQQVEEKLRIVKAKLQLSLNAEVGGFEESELLEGHQCKDCNYTLDATASGVYDTLPDYELCVDGETKTNLVHIAGYVARKGSRDETSDTYHYSEKFGDYTATLNRGGLTTPGDKFCQWAIFCYIIFGFIKDDVCRTSLSKVFQRISDEYGFEMDSTHVRVLANILLNRFCKLSTPLLRKELKQKITKLF